MTCQGKLVIGDDFGDSSCTFVCGLDPGHDGPCMEKFEHIMSDKDGNTAPYEVIVSWKVVEEVSTDQG